MQSVPITTNVVSSNPAHGEVYSIQHYVIKFVNDLREIGGGFFSGTSVSSTNNTFLASLCCPIMCLYILSYVSGVRYDFRIKTMFGSSFSPVVCRRAHVLLCYLCMSLVLLIITLHKFK
jgi:hypothetical protein